MADYKILGNDERIHVFRHTAPGVWTHYSRPRWEKNALEREEDKRQWTKEELQAWIAANQAGGGSDPISDAEMAWVRRGVAKGFHGQASEEPKADPEHKKPEPQFKCDECKDWKPESDKSPVFGRIVCKSCSEQLWRRSRGVMGGL